VRDAAGELHHLDAALDVPLGIGDGLAVLAGQEVGERIHLAVHKVQKLHQDAGAPLRVRRRPRGLRGGPVLDRLTDLGLRGEGDLGDDIACHRLEHVAEAAGLALDLAPANKVPDVAHRAPPVV
jgi:hypothetical protein